MTPGVPIGRTSIFWPATVAAAMSMAGGRLGFDSPGPSR